MANRAKVALAVGAGYLLGRTKRARLALMLAAAGVTGNFPSSPTDLVAHGVKSLGTSGQLTDLTDQLRGELLNAAKAAALAAATSRVDALNDRLQGAVSPPNASDVTERVSAPVSTLTGRRSEELSDDEDIYDADEVDIDDDEMADDEDEYDAAELADEDDEEPRLDEEPEPA